MRACRAESDSRLIDYGREHGGRSLLTAARYLEDCIRYDTESAYRKSLQDLREPVGRLYHALGNTYGMTGYVERWSIRSALSFEAAVAYRTLGARAVAVREDRYLDREDLVQVSELLSRIEEIDPLSNDAIQLDVKMAQAMDLAGDYEAELRFYRRGLARARARGPTPELTSMLCHVGFVLGKISDTDSTRIYYEEALSLARRMEWANGTIRALKLLSSWQNNRGHLAQAYELAMEATRVAHEFRSGLDEWYGLEQALEINVALGAWDVVDGLVSRGKAVISENHSDSFRQDLVWFEALLTIARGNPAEGNRLFESVRNPVRARPQKRQHYASLILDWGRALLDAGEPRRALPLLQEGSAYAEAQGLPGERIKMASLLALALVECGRFDAADSVLSAFRDLASPDPLDRAEEWIRYDRTSIESARARGDTAAAARAVGRAMNRLGHLIDRLEATETSYLFLDSSQDLREEIHRALAGNPEVGYGFELFWRSLYPRLGRSVGAGPPRVTPEAPEDGSVSAWLVRRARRLQERLRAADARHFLYMVGADYTIRWEAGGAGVRRTVLPGSSDSLRRETRAAVTALAAESDPHTPFLLTPLPGMLAGLAERLLPREDPADDSSRTIYLSPDRFLASLPFEALNLSASPGTYDPLLARRDVAYLRVDGGPCRPPRTGDRGIIVADPARSPDFKRRYPGLSRLPDTVAEADRIQALSPGSTLLQGAAATKAALTRGWEQARFLYIAAHFVRDAEVPYLLFLPLAPPTGSSADGEVFLDVTEIRKAHLSDCALVVLSGCSSGAPYSDLARWGPSLGDAFLDAGAHAVIQTFWPVDDRQAQETMAAWTNQWAAGRTPLRALCTARRACLESAGAVAHPHSWAAYSIQLGGL